MSHQPVDRKSQQPEFSLQQAVEMGFDLPVPCRIRCDDDTLLDCDRCLRVLPGKRLVVRARWLGDSQEQWVVAKLLLGERRSRKQVAAEVEGLKLLQTEGIAAPALLEWQQRNDCGWLLIDYIDNAMGLDEYWYQRADEAQRIACRQQLLGLFGELHRAGLKQTDIHLDNFLVADDKLYAIDGATVQKANTEGMLAPAQAIENLAILIAQFYARDDQVLIDAVCAGEYPTTIEAGTLRSAVDQQRLARLLKYHKKVYRQSTEHLCENSFRRFQVWRRARDSEGLRALMADPDRFIEAGEKLKLGNTATVARVSVDGRDLVVKRYNIKNLGHRLSRALRPSRAWVSWGNAHLLTMLGVATPEPVAMIEERIGALRGRAYFICDAVAEPSEPLDKRILRQGLSIAQVRAAMADIFDALQRYRISHGDMKATNFICHGEHYYVIDLDAMTLHQNPGHFEKAWAKDLARFERNWS